MKNVAAWCIFVDEIKNQASKKQNNTFEFAYKSLYLMSIIGSFSLSSKHGNDPVLPPLSKGEN